jgi:hypothetical protein
MIKRLLSRFRKPAILVERDVHFQNYTRARVNSNTQGQHDSAMAAQAIVHTILAQGVRK